MPLIPLFLGALGAGAGRTAGRLIRFTKTNSEMLDYTFAFAPSSAWLETGETIASHQILTEPPNEIGVESITNTGSSLIAFIGHGQVGSVYCVTALVTTSKGRQTERTFEIGVVGKR